MKIYRADSKLAASFAGLSSATCHTFSRSSAKTAVRLAPAICLQARPAAIGNRYPSFVFVGTSSDVQKARLRASFPRESVLVQALGQSRSAYVMRANCPAISSCCTCSHASTHTFSECVSLSARSSARLPMRSLRVAFLGKHGNVVAAAGCESASVASYEQTVVPCPPIHHKYREIQYPCSASKSPPATLAAGAHRCPTSVHEACFDGH